MIKNDPPYSGPFSSYWTNVSSMNLQLMISTQFTDQQCLDWEKSVRSDLKMVNSNLKTDPIVERLKDAPLFMLNGLQSSFISSTIINFTSTTEHYLKDMIKLSLQRNAGFRKRAFKDFQLSAMDLEEFEDVNKIKIKIIRLIASDQSKGPLFSSKFSKTCKFLTVYESALSASLLKSLDSIWELRNKIAHSNSGLIQTYELVSMNGLISISNEPQKQEYFDFCITLLKTIDDFTILLEKWDNAVINKWPANSFIS